MSGRESAQAALQRWERLEVLQTAYPTFVPFLHDMMQELGFTASEIQEDIGLWMQFGPAILMVQAQRGQAKTTIAAIFSVWSLIHNPKFRVLIVSAGETQANEISTLIVRLIQQVPELEMLRPDSSNGDRTSVEHFDVHYSLKGIDKSPSVACVGINSNLPGKRADLLIADDVESPKNGTTATQRAALEHLTKEFSSISVGRILWLGTPQSTDSIYNNLPGRGVAVRIWPGRYPSPEQIVHYGDQLAPIILRRLAAGAETTGYGLDGMQGAPVDPVIKPEEELLKKEMDQGAAQFQLQFMLLTAMTDAMRYPLKVSNLIALSWGQDDVVPMTIIRGFDKGESFGVNGQKYLINRPHHISPDTAKLQSKVFYIDPAGGGLNADESAYAGVGLLNSNLFWGASGGVPGGYADGQLQAMADAAVAYNPQVIKIEKNFGFGSYAALITPILRKAFEAAHLPLPAIEEDMVSGQKELRLAGTLEPIIGRGSLIISNSILENEADSVKHYDARLRNTYSVLFQLSKLTRDKDSLIHDDRLDALEGACRHFVKTLVVDQEKAIKAIQAREFARLNSNPLGKPAYALRGATRPMNATQRRIRKV